MNSEFDSVMAQKTDEQLFEITTIKRDDYQDAAIESAEKELKKRQTLNPQADLANIETVTTDGQETRRPHFSITKIIIILIVVSGLAYGLNIAWEKKLQNSFQKTSATDDSSLNQFPPTLSMSKNYEISYVIPEHDSLKQEGEGSINTYGDFLPDEDSFSVHGGLVSSIDGRDDIVKQAQFGDWAYLYKSEKKQSPNGWIPVLTEGEILIKAENLTPLGIVHTGVQSICELEQIDDNLFVARLNPQQGHRIGMLNQAPLLATVGSLITFEGEVLNCQIDGWYLNGKCLTPFDPDMLLKKAEIYLTQAHDREAAYLLAGKIIEKIPQNPEDVNLRESLANAHFLRAVSGSTTKDLKETKSDYKRARDLTTNAKLIKVLDEMSPK